MPAAAARPLPPKAAQTRAGAEGRGARRPHADAEVARRRVRSTACACCGCAAASSLARQPITRRLHGASGSTIDARTFVLPGRRERQRLRQVGTPLGVERVDDRLVGEQVQRVGPARHDRVQARRRDADVGGVLAVGVVVDGLAEPAQAGALCGVQARGGGQPVGHRHQVVAIGADQRPGAIAPAEVAVHQQAGADLAAEVEMGLEVGVLAARRRPHGDRSSARARRRRAAAAAPRDCAASTGRRPAPRRPRRRARAAASAISRFSPVTRVASAGSCRRHCSTAHSPSASPLQTSKRRRIASPFLRHIVRANSGRRASSGRALSTSAACSQPRRAWPIPKRR